MVPQSISANTVGIGRDLVLRIPQVVNNAKGMAPVERTSLYGWFGQCFFSPPSKIFRYPHGVHLPCRHPKIWQRIKETCVNGDVIDGELRLRLKLSQRHRQGRYQRTVLPSPAACHLGNDPVARTGAWHANALVALAPGFSIGPIILALLPIWGIMAAST